MLILTRRKDEKIIIGDGIEISVVDIRGDQIKLGIKAPSDVKVFRYEIFEAIQAENKAAAAVKSLPSLNVFKKEKKL